MNKFFTLLLVFLIYNSLECQVAGEQSVYSLDDCIEIAMENNFDIQLSETSIKTASANLTSAFGSYLPNVNFNMGFSRQLNVRTINIGGINLPIKASPNNYSMSAIAGYTIFDGFSREAVYSSARDNLEATSMNSEYTVKKVLLDVYRQYITIVRNSQIVKIRRENIELGRKQLERIQAIYKAGNEPIGTVYSQEADLGNRELELVKAENDMNVAKAVLLSTRGLEPRYDVEFLEKSIPATITNDEIVVFRKRIGSLRATTKKALKNRLDFKSTESTVQAAKANVSNASSGYYPRLSASGGWSWSNSQFTGFGDFGRSFMGLNLTVPLFDNFNTNNRIQTAKLTLEQRQVERKKLEQNIRSYVQTAFLNLDAAEKQVEITGRSLKSATRNYESSNERFQTGAINITDLIFANTQLITAKINRITAIYGYVYSQKEVLFGMGKLD